MDAHSMSKLTMASVKRPVTAGTKKRQTFLDESLEQAGSALSLETQDAYDPLYVHQPEPPNFKSYSNSEPIALKAFDSNRETLTAEFYSKLQNLKKEHKKTLKLLSQLYEDSNSRQCNHSARNHQEAIKIKRSMCGSHQNRYYDDDESDDEPIQIPMDSSRIMNSQSHEPRYQDSQSDGSQDTDDEEKSAMSSYAESTEDVVSRMWEDFTLESYLEKRSTKDQLKSKRNVRPRSAPPKKKEWSPIITIPKPFKMTLREEEKKGKSHTSSSHEISLHERERREKEEDELGFRIRPREPPAHIYLPLFDEFRERQEQRSRFNRENAISTLVALQKPFSFAERDEEKRKEREHKKRQEELQKLRNIKKMSNFEASPVPYSVHDPTVSDRIIEEGLYRKIKKKMRSEDLMRSSALPPRMQAHEVMAGEKRRVWQREVDRTTAHSFRPVTHDVPDFDALHKRQQFESYQHKMDRETTASEPFRLRTSERSRQKFETRLVEPDESFEKPKQSRRRPKTAVDMSITDSIPARLTDSSRLRIENMKRSLQEAERIIQRAKEEDEERKERRKLIAQQVAQKSAGNDVALTSETEKEKKLKQYKKQLRERQIEYNKFLQEVKQRVDDRPLLFEQHNEKMAKAQAEKRYREILESSGLSDDFVINKSRLSASSDGSAHFQSRDLLTTNDSYASDAFERDDDVDSSASYKANKKVTEKSKVTTKVSFARNTGGGSSSSEENSDVEEEDTKPKELEVEEF